MEQKTKRFKKKMSRVQIIAFGFFCIIMIGTALLMLPVSSRNGMPTDFLTSLFTATSATCVTGLVLVDTYTHWSVFGQVVILLMIQVGGLGFVTIGVSLLVVFKRRVGISQRGLLQESVNALQVNGIVKLTKLIVGGTALIEGIGAILLSFKFIPLFGPAKGAFYSIFHAVSAFCNAGFDLMGQFGEYSSLSYFTTDIYVNVVIMSLITIGAIGFLVWKDVVTNKWHFRKYSLHSKIVFFMTFWVLIISTVLFMIFEWNNTMADMTVGEKIIASMFSSVTARTAGFNTVDTGALRDCSKLLTIFLMFMGGSPGSTAGGIKTTTILVVFLYLWSNLRNSSGANIFNRRLDDDTIKKASLVFYINILLACGMAMVISSLQNINFIDVVFEVFSAIGTVGMSSGITRDLSVVSRCLIILLMYCGRIGSMTFALSFIENRKQAPVKYPVEKITVG